MDDPVNYSYHDHQLRPVTQETKDEEEEFARRQKALLDAEAIQLELPFGRKIRRHRCWA